MFKHTKRIFRLLLPSVPGEPRSSPHCTNYATLIGAAGSERAVSGQPSCGVCVLGTLTLFRVRASVSSSSRSRALLQNLITGKRRGWELAGEKGY